MNFGVSFCLQEICHAKASIARNVLETGSKGLGLSWQNHSFFQHKCFVPRCDCTNPCLCMHAVTMWNGKSDLWKVSNCPATSFILSDWSKIYRETLVPGLIFWCWVSSPILDHEDNSQGLLYTNECLSSNVYIYVKAIHFSWSQYGSTKLHYRR